MKTDLFISYNSSDSQLAFRIYSEIIKNGGTAYIYETQTDFVDYRAEIKQSINEASAFCLIDSLKARASKWVRFECAIAHDLKKAELLKHFFICSADNIEMLLKQEPYFEGSNFIRTADFSLSIYNTEQDKKFDFEDRFNKGIQSICKALKIQYTSNLPSIEDFKNELEVINLDGEKKQSLITDFNTILIRLTFHPIGIEERLTILINDCKSFRVQCISPDLVLGSFLIDQKNLEKAESIYFNISQYFKEDPRGWLGVSYINFELKKYTRAYFAIEQAENIFNNGMHNPKFKRHHIDLLHNKIKIQILTNRKSLARNELNRIDRKTVKIPEFKILELHLRLLEDRFVENDIIYNHVDAHFKTKKWDQNSILLIAELEHNIGRYFAEKGDFNFAIAHYKKAIHYLPKNIQYSAEIGLLYAGTGETTESKKIAHIFTNYSPSTPEEYYYLGLIHFLNSDTHVARSHFQKAKMELGANYVFYDQLIS